MLYYASVDWPLTPSSPPLPPSQPISPTSAATRFPSLGTSSIQWASVVRGRRDWMNYKSLSDALTRPTWYARSQITAIHAFCICKCPSIIHVMSLPRPMFCREWGICVMQQRELILSLFYQAPVKALGKRKIRFRKKKKNPQTTVTLSPQILLSGQCSIFILCLTCCLAAVDSSKLSANEVASVKC